MSKSSTTGCAEDFVAGTDEAEKALPKGSSLKVLELLAKGSSCTTGFAGAGKRGAEEGPKGSLVVLKGSAVIEG